MVFNATDADRYDAGFGAHGSSSMLSKHPNTSDAELLGEGVEPTTTGFRINRR